MNILFISSLSRSLSTGPAWSVPARVVAQSKIDNVYWVNLSDANHQHWIDTGVYHNISEFQNPSLNALPDPFNRPDIVMFEGFYGGFKEIRFVLDCWRYNIPYIITPRGSLTSQAMHNKSRWKKKIAHLLFYDRFVRRATAVQYLTKQEYEDSKYRFDGPHYILPNGFNTPKETKSDFSKDRIKGIFIGRIDIYHKGLDLLFDAIAEISDELRNNNFSLDIYGPKRLDYNNVIEILKNKKIDDIVKLKGEILGEEKKNAILGSDVFFLTSRFEGHPMGLIEALAYGLPGLVTTGCNMGTEVEQYKAGWCSNITKQGISQSILKMIGDKDLINEYSKNAISLASIYRWDTLAYALHKIIEKLIK